MFGKRDLVALALAAALSGACSEEASVEPADGSTPSVAAPVRLVELAELDAAVKRNLQRGTLVALWATW